MRNSLESKDVTISKLQGKLTVNILGRIMFDSGEADLKPDGEAVLAKVAAFLAQHPELKIHVIGHTDNVPIRGGDPEPVSHQLELSTARALAAVRFLTERAGLDPHRVGAGVTANTGRWRTTPRRRAAAAGASPSPFCRMSWSGRTRPRRARPEPRRPRAPMRRRPGRSRRRPHRFRCRRPGSDGREWTGKSKIQI